MKGNRKRANKMQQGCVRSLGLKQGKKKCKGEDRAKGCYMSLSAVERKAHLIEALADVEKEIEQGI